jgi:2-polyprenyl-3-methyl-5-hydroxy-6-metoxy-1,4-benzoquinol methylase
MLKAVAKRIAEAAFPIAMKNRAELQYWKERHSLENGQLGNSHYEALYTTVYGLTKADFAGKRILDIGCGPRGSLEWADNTLQRVGLDPLADDYRKQLGASRHRMEYCAAPSHRIPFPDGHFDIVTSINALDHVDDVLATIDEIKRVTKSGSMLLLSVEIDHPATATEPMTIDDAVLAKFAPEFSIVSDFRVGTPTDHNVHGAVQAKSPPHVHGQPGIYVGKFLRR